MKYSMKNLLGKALKVSVFSLLVSMPNFGNAKATYMTPNKSMLTTEVIRTNVWTSYATVDGIKIEYKFQDCDTKGLDSFRNQTLVFLKFTNTTSNKLALTYQREVYMDNECANCNKIGSGEHTYTVKLDANQVIEGNCTTMTNHELFIFANFITLIDGMTETRLTDFKLINLKTSVWK